jgi:septal ring factor EnvC (AmiA/AmiB activator)
MSLIITPTVISLIVSLIVLVGGFIIKTFLLAYRTSLVEKRLDGQHSAITALKETMTTGGQPFTELSRQIDALSGTIERISLQTQDQEKQLARLTERIDALTRNIADLRPRP